MICREFVLACNPAIREALDAAIALGLAHEGRRAFDAEEGELALVVVGDELAAVIVADLQAAGDARGEAAEAGTHPLAQRLQRLEPGRPAGGVDADAFRRAVIDRDEDRGLPSPVRVEVRSVPHMASTRSVRIVPSCALGPWGRPIRLGANRSCARISRSTRRLEVRMPAKRSRAQTLRWPSPWKGLAASSARICSTSPSSDIGPTGPGRRLGRGSAVWPRCRYSVARDVPQTRVTRCTP
jgi:hypothetical protein